MKKLAILLTTVGLTGIACIYILKLDDSLEPVKLVSWLFATTGIFLGVFSFGIQWRSEEYGVLYKIAMSLTCLGIAIGVGGIIIEAAIDGTNVADPAFHLGWWIAVVGIVIGSFTAIRAYKNGK